MTATREQFRIIKRPLMTEKSSLRQADDNCYTFEVELNANKSEIAAAVREIFDVKVKKVRTMRVKGRKRRRNRNGYFNERDKKKALVTLEEGEVIEIT